MSEKTSFFEKQLNLPIKTIVLENVDSTNNYCKKIAKATANDALVVAFAQSNGKGRMGRNFYSPTDSGIYVSYLLHPALSAEESSKITTAAAVAAAKAIENISSKKAYIKWVNDIYVDNKKVCGILTESAISAKGELEYAVMGLGVNLFAPLGGFPDDIKDKAGSVFKGILPSTDTTISFIKEFHKQFISVYNILPDNYYMEEYKSRSLLKGKTVTFIKDGKENEGFVLGIDNEARLLLSTENGAVTLSAGEVSVKF